MLQAAIRQDNISTVIAIEEEAQLRRTSDGLARDVQSVPRFVPFDPLFSPCLVTMYSVPCHGERYAPKLLQLRCV